ncbi:hypothetical protein [Streptomyces sp. TRM49041]|uniref:hypothetical protein n=1 Tax=Streptomyces sp. TRM49041 TaxID=2603216 RepID=UPI00165685D0
MSTHVRVSPDEVGSAGGGGGEGLADRRPVGALAEQGAQQEPRLVRAEASGADEPAAEEVLLGAGEAVPVGQDGAVAEDRLIIEVLYARWRREGAALNTT